MTQSANAPKLLVCRNCSLREQRSTQDSLSLTTNHFTNRGTLRAMTQRAFRTCGKPGCPVLIKEGSHCPKHAEQAQQREYGQRNADEVMKLYRTQRWERFKIYMRSRNPLCQRLLDNGQQCDRIAVIL